MENKKPAISIRHKKLADQLRGNMSYKEHYAYLLDWYANDKNSWRVRHGKQATNHLHDTHVKETFNDVLESLKHLDNKIEAVSDTIAYDINKAEKRMKVGAKRMGNIFTRLVDARKFKRINA